MINRGQNITREPLGRNETRFLVKMAATPTFSIEEARSAFAKDLPPQFLDRLQRKGWIRRIKRGRFALIPLSSGETGAPQLHEFLIAMELVSPAAIAYWSALNHHGMTEQIPRTVFVATNHHIQLSTKETLGVTFKIISVNPKKFFGVVKDWINEQPFSITDKEKTIIDGLDLPKYVGGVGEITKALKQVWEELDEAKLRDYAAKIGNTAVAKRSPGSLASIRSTIAPGTATGAWTPGLARSTGARGRRSSKASTGSISTRRVARSMRLRAPPSTNETRSESRDQPGQPPTAPAASSSRSVPSIPMIHSSRRLPGQE